MYNKAFEFLGLDYFYVAFRVKEDVLAKAVEGIRSLEIRGANVTIPYKLKVMEYLDEVDDLALEIGAVNTIINEDGRLTGLNTDGVGAIEALREKGCKLKDKRVMILGAGGGGRAVSYFAAREFPSELMILNRTEEKAFGLAQNLKRKFDTDVKHYPLDSLKKEIENTDVLINCTSVGMFPNDDSIVPKDFLRKDLTVMDIVYNPIETKLLREAKDVGAKTIDGVGMLVNQGDIAFKLWTGKEAPVGLMRKVVTESGKI
jgi:shikimate dehydrogenase